IYTLSLHDALPISRAGRDEVLLHQLLVALEFLARQVEARLGGLDVALHRRARARHLETGAFGAGEEARDQLALLHRRAALDVHRFDHALDRGADLERLARLDQ